MHHTNQNKLLAKNPKQKTSKYRGWFCPAHSPTTICQAAKCTPSTNQVQTKLSHTLMVTCIQQPALPPIHMPPHQKLPRSTSPRLPLCCNSGNNITSTTKQNKNKTTKTKTNHTPTKLSNISGSNPASQDPPCSAPQ